MGCRHKGVFAIPLLVVGIVLAILLLGCSGREATASASVSAFTQAMSPTPIVPSISPSTLIDSSQSPPLSEATLDDLIAKSVNLSMKYEVFVSQTGPLNGSIMTIWQKGKKMRQESNLNGRFGIMITDMDNMVTYTYYPSESSAFKMDIPTDPLLSTNLPGTLAYLRDISRIWNFPLQLVGYDIIDGKTCTIIQIGISQTIEKIWVWQDKGVLLRVEATAAGVNGISEYKNYDFSDIPASMFALPAGIPIMEQGQTPGAPSDLPTTLPSRP
jgi:hypothetical protein